jgi:hypothetical protein
VSRVPLVVRVTQRRPTSGERLPLSILICRVQRLNGGRYGLNGTLLKVLHCSKDRPDVGKFFVVYRGVGYCHLGRGVEELAAVAVRPHPTSAPLQCH